jgi:hypothetical protein
MSDTAEPQKVRVQLAYPYTDADGGEHAPDDIVEVDLETSRRMLDEGRARRPDAEPERTAAVTSKETGRKGG